VNSDNTMFLARDHAAELLGEADRERLARQAQESQLTGQAKVARPAKARWTFLSGLRSAVAWR
jgi:hypothetical protein